MFKTLRKIKRFLFGPKTELEFTEAALKRYQDQLYEMNDAFDPTQDCCPDCMYGSCYGKLVDKIERVEHRIQVLRNRKLKHKSKKVK